MLIIEWVSSIQDMCNVSLQLIYTESSSKDNHYRYASSIEILVSIPIFKILKFFIVFAVQSDAACFILHFVCIYLFWVWGCCPLGLYWALAPQCLRHSAGFKLTLILVKHNGLGGQITNNNLHGMSGWRAGEGSKKRNKGKELHFALHYI